MFIRFSSPLSSFSVPWVRYLEQRGVGAQSLTLAWLGVGAPGLVMPLPFIMQWERVNGPSRAVESFCWPDAPPLILLNRWGQDWGWGGILGNGPGCKNPESILHPSFTPPPLLPSNAGTIVFTNIIRLSITQLLETSLLFTGASSWPTFGRISVLIPGSINHKSNHAKHWLK